jgi:hypothetical protein
MLGGIPKSCSADVLVLSNRSPNASQKKERKEEEKASNSHHFAFEGTQNHLELA